MKKTLLLLVLPWLLNTMATSAPTLVKSVPSDGASGISLSSKIVLQFSEEVVVGTGSCQLNGTTLAPTLASKYVTFQPTGLEYLSSYTFTIPAGAFKSKTGEAYLGSTFTFTTLPKPQPAAKLYDAVVAKDGTGNYTSVQKAIDAMPENRTQPWLIFVKNGVYDELVRISPTKRFVHLIGQDREKTIIQYKINCAGKIGDLGWEYSANRVGLAAGSVVVIESTDFFTENISYINTWGYETQNGPQALAIQTRNDRAVFNNVKMISFQDTWQTTSNSNDRHYSKNCFIEGAVDFIYSSGECYFDSCTLNIARAEGAVIVAPSHGTDVKWGYVFTNTTITAPRLTNLYYGRPWHNAPKTAFVNTKLAKNTSIYPAGWIDHMGGLPAIFADYKTTNYLGSPVDMSQRISRYWITDPTTGLRVESDAQKTLTAEQAANYTVRNVLSGTDNWRPEEMCKVIGKPMPVKNGDLLTWNPIAYAICYVITKNDSVIGFTKDTTFSMNAPGNYQIQAANEYGGLSSFSATITKTNTALAQNKWSDFTFELNNNTLRIKGLKSTAKLSIYSMSGVLLESTPIEGDAEKVLLQQRPCIIRLSSEQNVKTMKFIPN